MDKARIHAQVWAVKAFYNEIDLYCCAWLSNLMDAGLITPGKIDDRSIEDIRPDELIGYDRVHFFAGLGGWDLALNRAGYGESEIWTGSCPCQPFSTAGKAEGFTDERHLWPALHWLIQQRRPDTFFGEQVASKDGLAWLDLVQTDLENTGYASGAVDLCAAGIGSPNIRQRLWIVAKRLGHTSPTGLSDIELEAIQGEGRRQERGTAQQPGCAPDGVANTKLPGATRLGEHSGESQAQERVRNGSTDCGSSSRLANTSSERRQSVTNEQTSRIFKETLQSSKQRQQSSNMDATFGSEQPGPTNGFWRDADWLFCRDGKWRAVRPGSFPLANGVQSRVGRLRAYGNSVNVEAAKEFIRATM